VFNDGDLLAGAALEGFGILYVLEDLVAASQNLQAIDAASAKHELRARRCEFAGNAGANAARRAGDEDNLIHVLSSVDSR
jgi:hypothetical protein